MIEQFQNILNQPQPNYSQPDVLQSTRNLILNSLETTFPPDFDFDGLAQLINDPQIANDQALLNYHLVDYFIQLVQANFVSNFHYESLETQTQKMESTIRSHIRLEQEVKMYLEHLEAKLGKYENYFQNRQREPLFVSHELMPSQQETQLRKQRVSLVRANEKMKRQLQEKDQQLREKDHQLEDKGSQYANLRYLKTDSVKSMEALKRSLDSRSERRLGIAKLGYSTEKKEPRERWAGSKPRSKDGRRGTKQKDGDGLQITISGNNNEINYYVAQQ